MPLSPAVGCVTKLKSPIKRSLTTAPGFIKIHVETAGADIAISYLNYHLKN